MAVSGADISQLAGKIDHWGEWGGGVTPRGNTHWWPAQVQQLLNGVYDEHYRGAGAPT